MNRPNSHYRNMNPERANYIRELYHNRFNRFTQNELSNMYGVSQSTICRIISGDVWQ